MSRWQPDARERLEAAALDLFAERGFAEATIPDITARAGLTTRTFFRHFADKREVLFANEADIPEMAARMIAEAPLELTPMQVIEGGIEAVVAAQFAGGTDYLLRRKAVIESDDGLRERELRKMSMLADAIRSGFEARGEDALTASLAAHLTTTVFGISLGRWLEARGELELPGVIHETFDALRSMMSAQPVGAPATSAASSSRP